MLRYVVRRVLETIPTTIGIILVAFMLFNVVGGSPAEAILGKNATKEQIAEYDRVHGDKERVVPFRLTAAVDQQDIQAGGEMLRGIGERGAVERVDPRDLTAKTHGGDIGEENDQKPNPPELRRKRAVEQQLPGHKGRRQQQAQREQSFFIETQLKEQRGDQQLDAKRISLLQYRQIHKQFLSN